MDALELGNQIRQMLGNSVPGVAVIVVGPEGVRARAVFGMADLIAGRPMTTGVALPWFSMTKLVTATVALHLAERGVLDLDAPISVLVPAARVLRPVSWADQITGRHLLQHTAGLANPIPVRWIHPADRVGPGLDSMLAGLLAKNRRLRFRPGRRSSYSNLSALVLGSAIARAAGAPFESVVKGAILTPLDLHLTDFTFASECVAATGYHPRFNALRWLLPRWAVDRTAGRWLGLRPFLVDGAPYGGLVGPIEDAARFLRLHLRNGEVDGTRVLSEESATMMREITAPGRRYDLGLAWFVPADSRRSEPPFVEHLGGGAGFFNLMRMYPGHRVGVVVMGNATKYDVNSVANLAAKSYW